MGGIVPREGGHKHSVAFAGLHGESCSSILIKHDFDEQMSLLNQEEMKEKAKVEDEKKDEEKEDPKGIPEFWLTVFKNVDLLSDIVQVFIHIKMGRVTAVFCSVIGSAATCWTSCVYRVTTFI